MIEKARSREENLPSVRIFRAEINAIVGLFNEYCVSYSISDDEYVYKDMEEMRERVGARFRKFQIVGVEPSVSLSFEPLGVKLGVVYKEGESEEIKKRGDHLFLRLKEFLGKNKTAAAQFMNPTAITILVFVGILTMLFSIVTSPRPANIDPNAVYLDLKHGLFLVLGILILLLVGFLGARRVGYYFVYYGYAHERTSFWSRKKDDLIFGILMAVIGAVFGVIGTLITQHFHK